MCCHKILSHHFKPCRALTAGAGAGRSQDHPAQPRLANLGVEMRLVRDGVQCKVPSEHGLTEGAVRREEAWAEETVGALGLQQEGLEVENSFGEGGRVSGS